LRAHRFEVAAADRLSRLAESSHSGARVDRAAAMHDTAVFSEWFTARVP
jgi:hypothetical protein